MNRSWWNENRPWLFSGAVVIQWAPSLSLLSFSNCVYLGSDEELLTGDKALLDGHLDTLTDLDLVAVVACTVEQSAGSCFRIILRSVSLVKEHTTFTNRRRTSSYLYPDSMACKQLTRATLVRSVVDFVVVRKKKKEKKVGCSWLSP